MKKSLYRILPLLLALLGCSGGGEKDPDWRWPDPPGGGDEPTPPAVVDPNQGIVDLGWTNEDSSMGSLPGGLHIYKSPSSLEGASALAYIAVADPSTVDMGVWGISDVSLQGSTDALQTPSDLYGKYKAPVIINGGYFYSSDGKNYASSMAVSGGNLLSPNINYASEDWVSIYYPTRGVFMQGADGKFSTGWSYFRDDSHHWVYPSAAQNSWSKAPLQQPSATFPSGGKAFSAQNAIGGGPVLIRNGKIEDTYKEELLDGSTGIDPTGAQPRTAVGVTADGKLVFFVCEGREMTSGVKGYSTAQVASILKSLGCVDAMNLDGGGSSCMLVNGKTTIKPSDGRERSVGSALMLCEKGKAPVIEPVVPKTAKPRYLWIDASANFSTLANSKSNIASELEKIERMGFTDVIVDVRPTTGDVLFRSSIAPELKRIDAWVGSSYRFLERTATFDYLQAFIDEGHKLGLKVNAAINTFVGGYLCPYGLGSEGMLFDDPSRKDWASVANLSSGLTNTMDLLDDATDYGAKFLSPANPEVQEYILGILGELAHYDLDGIVLDRCRFDDYGLRSDFSKASLDGFSSYYGRTVEASDIFAPGTSKLPSTVPDIVKQWLAYRAKTIHDFVEKAEAKVHSVNPSIRFGAYFGAWYSDYYPSGVNWGSRTYDPSSSYRWASSSYKDYGVADLVDFMFLGAYASTTSIYGSGEWTFEGFCKVGARVINGATPFAAGPDVGNPTGWADGGQQNVIPTVVKVCLDGSDGLFVFDLSHIRMYDYWDAFKGAIDDYLAKL